jgi:LmbE family N-acetylglucosaminyl deacetylase
MTRQTLVSFHAHPDDEALLTGGTLARAAAAGHRVVLVTATCGEAGLAARGYGDPNRLGRTRRDELERAAAALGCARLVTLDYPDSGMDGRSAGPDGFAHQPVEQVAQRLAAVLVDERAGVLTGYDQAGGYGHPDHVQVHRVAARAAALAGTPMLLEATIDRRLLLAATCWMPRLPGGARRRDLARAFADPATITHRIDVRSQLGAKTAALAAHRSQRTADRGTRTVQALLRLPGPLLALALGREWFVDPSGLHEEDLRTEIFDIVLEVGR